MHNPKSVLENETHKLLRFLDTNGSPNLGQTDRSSAGQQQQQQQQRNEKLQDRRICRHCRPQSKIQRK